MENQGNHGFVSPFDTNTETGIIYKRIDHIAVAVPDIELALTHYCDVLRFKLVRRLEIKGKKTGMLSAELVHGEIKLVLCQGTEPESQVSQLVSKFGPGVAHIAFEVADVQESVSILSDSGLAFDTSVIGGESLQQAFSSRDPNSGIAFELIKRNSEAGFVESNVQELFDQLEKTGSY